MGWRAIDIVFAIMGSLAALSAIGLALFDLVRGQSPLFQTDISKHRRGAMLKHLNFGRPGQIIEESRPYPDIDLHLNIAETQRDFVELQRAIEQDEAWREIVKELSQRDPETALHLNPTEARHHRIQGFALRWALMHLKPPNEFQRAGKEALRDEILRNIEEVQFSLKILLPILEESQRTIEESRSNAVEEEARHISEEVLRFLVGRYDTEEGFQYALEQTRRKIAEEELRRYREKVRHMIAEEKSLRFLVYRIIARSVRLVAYAVIKVFGHTPKEPRGAIKDKS